MEYCGAGSVSDIIRLRNKTVGAYKVTSCTVKVDLPFALTTIPEMYRMFPWLMLTPPASLLKSVWVV